MPPSSLPTIEPCLWAGRHKFETNVGDMTCIPRFSPANDPPYPIEDQRFDNAVIGVLNRRYGHPGIELVFSVLNT
jgi:hypothetical protein